MTDLSLRQHQLLDVFRGRTSPITGTDLASLFGVTRQVVVHDVAVVRAAGHAILSTPQGYLLPPAQASSRPTRILAVCHPAELTKTELLILVDHGLVVHDVVVEHPLYGELRGTLRLSSRKDVEWFIEQAAKCSASLLSSLTDGHHLHTVEYTSEQRLQDAIQELRSQGIQVD